jgi:hypothetical protein
VQLHTPPSANISAKSANNNKPIYPVLNNNPLAQAQASSGSNNNKVSPGSSKNLSLATARPLSTTPNNAAVNHQYEAKTAILPNSVSGAGRKKRFDFDC